MDSKKRLIACMEKIEESSFDSLIVTSIRNLQYLIGLELDSGERMSTLLITPGKEPILILHEMFIEKVTSLEDVIILPYKDGENPIQVLLEKLNQTASLGIDQNWPSTYLIELQNKNDNLKIYSSYIVEKLREIKDVQEIRTLRQSARIADAVMHQISKLQNFPATEKMIAENIRDFFGEHGVEELSFQPIICFGENTANPHHSPSNININLNQPILLDIGGVYNQYCSDITRMHYVGSPNSEYEELYNIVEEAQIQAIEKIKPGVRFSEIDHFIREKFKRYNYDENFIHRTGHGIGLELHEGPFIHGNNHDYVQEGMVFSIEPGIYLPNQFGVRIEDIVVVHETGSEILNLCSKELQYIDLTSDIKI